MNGLRVKKYSEVKPYIGNTMIKEPVRIFSHGTLSSTDERYEFHGLVQNRNTINEEIKRTQVWV